MNFRNKLIGRAIFLFASCILAVGCGGGETKKPPTAEVSKSITMRLADIHPPDYPTVIGDRKFAELVEQKTNGRIKINVYHSGQLGDEKFIIEQIQLGAIELTRVSSSPLGEFSKPLGVFNLPYLFDDEEHLWRYLGSPEGKTLLLGLESSKMHGLTYYAAGTRSFYGNKPLTGINDLKGKRIRVQQSKINMDMAEALGVKAIQMPYGEVLNSLQVGSIDCAENNFPSYFSANHYQAAKYYINDKHQMVPEVLLISKVAWDKLSDEDKKIVEEAAWESTKFQMESWNTYEKEARDKVIAAGSIVTEITDLRPWQEAVKPMIDNYRGEFKTQLEDIEKYRKK